jgi:hypothetical protein
MNVCLGIWNVLWLVLTTDRYLRVNILQGLHAWLLHMSTISLSGYCIAKERVQGGGKTREQLDECFGQLFVTTNCNVCPASKTCQLNHKCNQRWRQQDSTSTRQLPSAPAAAIH